MATLPVGFFMPLPLPIMIPFMMWQSAAIAAGFGTYFQYAKRKVSAMSNDEFNASRPTDLVNELFDDITANIPSSFAQIRSLNTIILQSLADFLQDGVNFLSKFLGGQLNTPFQFSGPPTQDLPNLTNPFAGLTPEQISGLPGAGATPPPPSTLPPNTFVDPRNLFPPAPPPTQEALLAKYANWETYRSKGGLLQLSQWRLARRGLEGGLPNIKLPNAPTQGKIKHPSYVRTLQKMLNEKANKQKQISDLANAIKKSNFDLQSGKFGTPKTAQAEFARANRMGTLSRKLSAEVQTLTQAILDFVKKFRP